MQIGRSQWVWLWESIRWCGGSCVKAVHRAPQHLSLRKPWFLLSFIDEPPLYQTKLFFTICLLLHSHLFTLIVSNCWSKFLFINMIVSLPKCYQLLFILHYIFFRLLNILINKIADCTKTKKWLKSTHFQNAIRSHFQCRRCKYDWIQMKNGHYKKEWRNKIELKRNYLNMNNHIPTETITHTQTRACNTHTRQSQTHTRAHMIHITTAVSFLLCFSLSPSVTVETLSLSLSRTNSARGSFPMTMQASAEFNRRAFT